MCFRKGTKHACGHIHWVLLPCAEYEDEGRCYLGTTEIVSVSTDDTNCPPCFAASQEKKMENDGSKKRKLNETGFIKASADRVVPGRSIEMVNGAVKEVESVPDPGPEVRERGGRRWRGALRSGAGGRR